MATSNVTTASGGLVGRHRECAAIDRALAQAATGESVAFVLRGEAGIGKTTLLSYAADRAVDATVLRTAGLESEADLAFAGLHGLLRPITDRLTELPDAQAAALGGALGLAQSLPTDRLLVSAATLSLIAAAAEARPVVCVIDDAQWLDPASADALLFAARRFRAEPIVMAFAARDGDTRAFSAEGVPDLPLAALGTEDANDLLTVSVPGAADAARAWLLEQAAGNPLALLELPRTLSREQLDGRATLPETSPLTAKLRSVFLGRVESLPDDARTALLIAAIDELGEAATVVRAATQAGLPESALDGAERAGLISIAAGRIVFGHPLVRTALEANATLTERRRAHQALAAALRGDEHADRRIWHQALGTLGPDDVVASALEESARRSQSRSGHAAAATAFARAAELSGADADRIDRLAAAAEAAWAAGDPDLARALIDQVMPLARRPARARILRLRGVIEARTGDVRRAIEILLNAAQASDDPTLTLESLIEAAEAAAYAGAYAQAASLGARASTLEPRTEADRFLVDALGGMAAALAGEHERAAPMLEKAIIRAERLDDPRLLIWATRMARLAGTVGDGSAQAARATATARERGLLSILPSALQEHSTALIGQGRFSLGYAAAQEAVGLARDSGQRWGASWSLANLASVDALRGDEERARDHAHAAIELAMRSGAMFIVGFARRALGQLDLTLGRPNDATDRLLALTEPDDPDSNPIIALWATPDVIEAATRCGRADELDGRLERYARWANRAPSPARESLLARCRALAGDGDVREQFERAVTDAGALSPFQRARTELLYGEWLRREREPREARSHLRRALELFEQAGTAPWVQRADAELRATGETARRRDPSTLDDLTPQELQIAALVASGLTNRQIAAQMYLSPRTIEYHLRKVFTKLDLTSRTELVRMGAPTRESA